MLIQVIIFFIVGFLIPKFIVDKKTAFILIGTIAIVWGIVYAPMWGLVGLGEMLFGYFIFKFTKD